MWQEQLIKYANTSKDKTVREMIEAMDGALAEDGQNSAQRPHRKSDLDKPTPY